MADIDVIVENYSTFQNAFRFPQTAPVTHIKHTLRPEIFSISCSFTENLVISYVGAPSPGQLAPPPTGNPGSAPVPGHRLMEYVGIANWQPY